MNITMLTCLGKSYRIKLIKCFGDIKICSPCYSLSRSSALDMLRWCLFSNGVTNPSMALIFRSLDQLFHVAFLFHTYYWTVLAANHEENLYSAQTNQHAWIYRLEISHWKGDFLKVFSKCGQQVTLRKKAHFKTAHTDFSLSLKPVGLKPTLAILFQVKIQTVQIRLSDN